MHNRCCNLLSMSKLTYLIQLCLIYTKEVIMFVKGLLRLKIISQFHHVSIIWLLFILTNVISNVFLNLKEIPVWFFRSHFRKLVG